MPKMTKYASAAVAATIAPAFDASKRYVRMPVIRATNAPSTIGTWCVGVCESSRHDWPNPDPDFARVASMVHSPPGRHPSMPGHSRIGTIFEPKAPHDKRDVARLDTISSSPSGGGHQVHSDRHGRRQDDPRCTKGGNPGAGPLPDLIIISRRSVEPSRVVRVLVSLVRHRQVGEFRDEREVLLRPIH